MSTTNIFWIFVQLFMLTTAATDYCKLCKKQGTHTMCKFPKPGPGPACGKNSEKPLSPSEIDKIISMHNELRNKVATGKTKLPKAADMEKLSWDDELAIICQRWIDQCIYEHDKCRDSERFAVGQNLGKSASSDPKVDHIKIVVEAWFKEIELYSATQLEYFKGDHTIGHFTQFVWAHTNLIGCGRVRYKKGSMTGDLVGCNYGPAGNWEGQRVYTKGAPCSRCPNETSCDTELTGLCSRSSRPLCYLRLGIILQIYIMVMLNTIM